MATWRYSETNSAEMADVGATAAAASHCVTSEQDSLDDDNSVDLSYSDLDQFPLSVLDSCPQQVRCLHVTNNHIEVLPSELGLFTNLVSLDISNNRLKSVADEICSLRRLRTFVARNNFLCVESIPKDFGTLPSLAVLNLSGNQLTHLPVQFTELPQLRCLYLGANQISVIPPEVQNMSKLEILYLGGNRLTCLPTELGRVTSLVSLVVSDNELSALPRSLTNLSRLQSLSLHNNVLVTLPPDIIRLPLVELSLRNNPFVVKFVEELTYAAPSLLELSGRAVKLNHITYSTDNIPASLVTYLDSAQSCVNPRCNGVYFTSRVEHVKFVDFCGKYRLPLMQYLCSPQCHSTSTRVHACISDESQDDVQPVSHRLKRVLLG